MNILLIGSEKDENLAQRMEQALSAPGRTATTFYPDLGSDATLPGHAIRGMQEANYYLYLVTSHSEHASYLQMLTPEALAPLCAAGVKVILIAASGGSPPANLAYLPCLFFLDEEMLSELLDGLADALALVDSIQQKDLYDLRYGSRDLEAFLETAQDLAMAYTGLESAWDEASDRKIDLFKHYASEVSFGVNFISHVRLESRAAQQPDYQGPITSILAGYQGLERDWRDIEMVVSNGDGMLGKLLAARCRTANFINLVYLIMALKLQPYCDQYLHMHGLKQKQEMRLPADIQVDAAQERLSFLMAMTGR